MAISPFWWDRCMPIRCTASVSCSTRRRRTSRTPLQFAIVWRRCSRDRSERTSLTACSTPPRAPASTRSCAARSQRRSTSTPTTSRACSIDILDTTRPLGQLTQPLLQAHADRASALTSIGVDQDQTLAALCLDGAPGCDVDQRIAVPLTRLLVGDWKLEGPSASWWKDPVNPTRAGFTTVTVEQGARLLTELIRRRIDLKALIECRGAVEGTAVVPVDSCNPESFRFLADVLDRLATDLWQVNTTPNAGSPSIRAGGVLRTSPHDTIYRDVSLLVSELRNLADDVDFLGSARQRIDALAATFPDLTAELVMETPIEIRGEAIATSAGKHPYIGVDLGIAHSGELDATYPYVGTNFYFAPVNKDAPLSQFDRRDQLRKRFSLLLGLTTETPDGELNEDLFSAGSLLAGAGFRITSSFRVNAGALVFKRQNPNPLVSDAEEEVTWFVAASFDIDLASFIGRLAGLYPDGS